MPKPPPPPRSKPKLPGPPKPRGPDAAKPPAEALAEVERALSVLQGRHPEAVRADRETQAAIESKRAKTEALAARASHQAKRRWLLRIGVGIVALGIAIAGGLSYSRRAARGAAAFASLNPRMAPFLAQGFTSDPASRFAMETLELAASEPTCFVAFASRAPGDGLLTVERPAGVLSGSDSVAWCSCGVERATVRLTTPEAGGGLAVVRIAASEIGGDFGLAFLDPRAAVTATPDECSGVALDAWIEKGRAPVKPDDAAVSQTLRKRLEQNGFRAVSSAPPTLPFAVIPASPETCVLAFSSAPEDVLSLRAAGGERPISDVAEVLGACSNSGKSFTVWRKGKGTVSTVRVGAAKIGGLHGLREAAFRLGFERFVAWVSEDDLAWDASATLRASGIALPEVTLPAPGTAPAHARLVALSLGGSMVRADGKEDQWACEPRLTPTSKDAVCVQSSALAWRVLGSGGKPGIAEATLPFWMSPLANVADPEVLALELSVLKLGRRLVAEGFEATTLEGVTETPQGARVIGRAGDDKILAISLMRKAPWAAPCNEGIPWVLEANLASPSWARPEISGVVPLAAGAQEELSCDVRGVDMRERKTVVFRHPADARK